MSDQDPDSLRAQNDSADLERWTAMLVGTWSYPAEEEPSGTGYVQFSENGFMYQFVYQADYPEKRLPVRLRYAVESTSALRFRPKGNPEGWLIQYRFENEALILTNPKRAFRCAKTPPEEVPQWFVDSLNRWLAMIKDKGINF